MGGTARHRMIAVALAEKNFLHMTLRGTRLRCTTGGLASARVSGGNGGTTTIIDYKPVSADPEGIIGCYGSARTPRPIDSPDASGEYHTSRDVRTPLDRLLPRARSGSKRDRAIAKAHLHNGNSHQEVAAHVELHLLYNEQDL
jgi:hypothetical protein